MSLKWGRRCILSLRDEIVYNVWSQAALSACTPANDFLQQQQQPFLATMAIDFIFSAAGYTVRVGGDRNSEGGGQVPPVGGKWVMSITQNHNMSWSWIAFPSEGNADERSDICYVMNVPGVGVAVFEVWLHLEWWIAVFSAAASMLLAQSKDSSPRLLIKVEGKGLPAWFDVKGGLTLWSEMLSESK